MNDSMCKLQYELDITTHTSTTAYNIMQCESFEF